MRACPARLAAAVSRVRSSAPMSCRASQPTRQAPAIRLPAGSGSTASPPGPTSASAGSSGEPWPYRGAALAQRRGQGRHGAHGSVGPLGAPLRPPHLRPGLRLGRVEDGDDQPVALQLGERDPVGAQRAAQRGHHGLADVPHGDGGGQGGGQALHPGHVGDVGAQLGGVGDGADETGRASSPPCSRRPRSRSHRGGPSGWSTRNSSSRSPIVMWSASTTDISEGRSSGTVRPSRVSTRPSKSSGSSPNSSRTSSCTRTRPVSMARLKPPGGRSAPSAVTGGSGKATASATRPRHARSSASKPPGRSLTASRHPPPSWRTGSAARWNSRRGVRRDWDWAARSSGPATPCVPGAPRRPGW